ncbi:MAG: sulfotransferase [Deltaproteobacteria bacterium]|nr:MAG: sulfotransferase [Deltaproteobacteria bacterium]
MAAGGPIFIIGTERSGSNLLRVILSAHSRIDVPHPLHVMKYFAPLEPRYGDLSRRENLDRLAGDVLRLARVHIHPWQVPLDRARLVDEADPRDLLGLLFGLHQQHLEATGKARWGNKSTFMLDHVDRVLRHRPDARFVWLVRDPRDVAVSSRKSVFSPFHPWFTARLWAEQQRRCLELEERLGADVVLRLRYEDLLADPEGTVRRLCAFLDEDFEPAMLRYHETREAQRGAALSESWQNTAAPVLRGNSGKWRAALSHEEIAAVEGECGELMDRLGYVREAPEPGLAPDRATLLRWRLQNERDRVRVEWRSLRHDRNHWRRWGRALLMDYLHLRSWRPGR